MLYTSLLCHLLFLLFPFSVYFIPVTPSFSLSISLIIFSLHFTLSFMPTFIPPSHPSSLPFPNISLSLGTLSLSNVHRSFVHLCFLFPLLPFSFLCLLFLPLSLFYPLLYTFHLCPFHFPSFSPSIFSCLSLCSSYYCLLCFNVVRLSSVPSHIPRAFLFFSFSS